MEPPLSENEVLRQVARSFHVTIRMLPAAMRGDVSLAYLVARAADTVADCSPARIPARLDLLRSARESLDSPEIRGYRPDDWAPLQRAAAERRLLQAWPGLWRRISTRPEADRRRLQTVLGHILDGQIFDLERFVEGAPPLQAEELDRYIYLVAGSVGEFWTDLGYARMRRFARENPERMRELGRNYGKGLQLVNVLRDRCMDAAMGRTYMAPEDIVQRTGQARLLLADGAAYCAALGSGRMRYATVLPALLGWRTLTLALAQPAGLLTPAKVSRTEMRRWMWRALPVWWSPHAVSRLAAQASR